MNDLAMLCGSRMDVQQTRLALLQRGQDDPAETMKKLEEQYDRRIAKELRRHPLWPWLSQFPGLGGVQTARLIALIDDPRRFPGQRCTNGHTRPDIYEVGDACPFVGIDDEPCGGTMLPPRTTTGVRSLWHYLGLHAVDGKTPMRQKGKRADWSPVGRTIVMMPSGIADSIVRLRVPVYREEYERQKERLRNERGVVEAPVAESVHGPAQSDDAAGVKEGSEVELRAVSDTSSGLRPFQIDALARKIAAKKFVGDLLVEWKRSIAA